MPNFLLLMLLAAFPALSTDMYLPAIPTLQKSWGISLAQANLSLVVYFVTFSFMLLVHGPLSDKYGRKPVVVTGVLIFIAGSALCAASDSITMLVLARVLQAVGAAAAAAIAMALAKDLYEGAERQKVLAYIGVIIPLCPMIAPSIGGLLLEHLSWRWIFVSQGALAFFGLYGSITLREPEFERTRGGVFAVAGRYISLLRNHRYTLLVAAFSLMPTAFFSFLAASSDIYISGFGISEQQFGLYFGFNALCLMLGSFLCSRLTVGYSAFTIAKISLAGMLCASGIMILVNGTAALQFMFIMGMISFFLGLSRPIAVHLTLDQVNVDVGAASSLINFSFFILGAIGMQTVSMNLLPKPLFIGLVGAVGSFIPIVALYLFDRIPDT